MKSCHSEHKTPITRAIQDPLREFPLSKSDYCRFVREKKKKNAGEIKKKQRPTMQKMPLVAQFDGPQIFISFIRAVAAGGHLVAAHDDLVVVVRARRRRRRPPGRGSSTQTRTRGRCERSEMKTYGGRRPIIFSFSLTCARACVRARVFSLSLSPQRRFAPPFAVGAEKSMAK